MESLFKAKKCSKCGQEKTLDQFYKNKKSQDGFKARCKKCDRDNLKSNKRIILTPKIGFKYCSKCKQEKSVDQFSILKTTKDELNSWCRGCVNKGGRERYQRNKQRKRKGKKIYDKRYYEKNKEKVRYKAKKYYLKNKSKMIAKNKEWRKTEKGKALGIRNNHKRKDLFKNAICDLTAKQWEEIKKAQNYKCAYCGETKHLYRDHIVPVSKGGDLTKSNIQGLCISCNSKKSNKIDSTAFTLILKS